MPPTCTAMISNNNVIAPIKLTTAIWNVVEEDALQAGQTYSVVAKLKGDSAGNYVLPCGGFSHSAPSFGVTVNVYVPAFVPLTSPDSCRKSAL